jgi:hypothetical protein
MRLVLEQECEHGFVAEHYNTYFGGAHGGDTSKCRGGSRIIIDPDNLRANLMAIWSRGFYGEAWDDSWTADFGAALSAALHIDRPESPLAEASRLVSEQQDALHIDQETG